MARGPEADGLPATQIFLFCAAALAILLLLAHGPVVTSPWIATIGYSIIAACSASLVFLALQESSGVSRVFDHRVLRFFGRYSYGLYIYHGIYFVYLRHLAGSIQKVVYSQPLAQMLDVTFGFGLSIALAMLSYHYVEAPILRLKSRFV
jgi:peptidoglycan/LPS O-acetylase OafA/YrhL